MVGTRKLAMVQTWVSLCLSTPPLGSQLVIYQCITISGVVPQVTSFQSPQCDRGRNQPHMAHETTWNIPELSILESVLSLRRPQSTLETLLWWFTADRLGRQHSCKNVPFQVGEAKMQGGMGRIE